MADGRPSEPPLRVLYVAPALPPARVPEADHALRDCLELAARGAEVHVLTMRKWAHAAPGITVHAIAEDWGWRDAPRIWRLLRDLRPDAVFVLFLGSLYDYRILPTLLPLIAKLAGRRTRVVTRFSNFGAGGWEPGLRAGVRRWLFRRLGPLRYGSLLLASDAFVVVGDWMLPRIGELRSTAASRTVVIPPPPLMRVHTDREAARRRGRAKLGVAEDETLVAFFGRLYRGKGIEALLEATPRLRELGPRVRLGLIGGYAGTESAGADPTVYARELDALRERLGLREVVVMSGEYEWESGDGSDYVSAIDIAVLPLSTGVSCSNSSFTALCAHGVPVVATLGARPDEALRHRENVFHIERNDAQAIEAGVSELLRDRELRSRIAEGAGRLASERFGWAGATEQLLALLAPGRGDTSVPAEVDLG